MFLRGAVLVMSLVVTVRATCYHGTSTTNEAGDTVCEVGGETLAVGEMRETADCFRCSCRTGRFSCCGYGYKAGYMIYEGHKLVKDENCAYHFEPL